MSDTRELFFVFCGCSYYAEGGVDDQVGIYRSLEEARAEMKKALVWFDEHRKADYPWGQIAVVREDAWMVIETVTTTHGNREEWRAKGEICQ